MNFTKFPRRKYLQGSTPVESMPALSKALGADVNLYVKRDDLLPGSAGGNKTRLVLQDMDTLFNVIKEVKKGNTSLTVHDDFKKVCKYPGTGHVKNFL